MSSYYGTFFLFNLYVERVGYHGRRKRNITYRRGLKKLEEELMYYKSVRRIEVSERIKTAIEYGDISENSEYDDAKNETSFHRRSYCRA